MTARKPAAKKPAAKKPAAKKAAAAKPATKKKPGPPRWHPTDEDRENVRLWVACGIRHETICRLLNISPPVLYREFEEDIDKARDIVHSKLVGKLFKDAMTLGGGPLYFILKTQFGYRETSRVQVEEGKKEVTEDEALNAMSEMLKDMDTEERAVFKRVLERRKSKLEDSKPKGDDAQTQVH